MIFRNDDVNPNTKFGELSEIYEVIRTKFPESEIISGVNVYGKTNSQGSVHPNPPFKDKDRLFFYDVDKTLDVNAGHDLGTVASHGLWHFDHANAPYNIQRRSILSSCGQLGTKLFIPPFNRFNEDTIKICRDNDIQMIGGVNSWKSLDFNEFNPRHKLWYFHSWKFTPETFKEKFLDNSADMGQLRADTVNVS